MVTGYFHLGIELLESSRGRRRGVAHRGAPIAKRIALIEAGLAANRIRSARFYNLPVRYLRQTFFPLWACTKDADNRTSAHRASKPSWLGKAIGSAAIEESPLTDPDDRAAPLSFSPPG
jgi:hypothetical protein